MKAALYPAIRVTTTCSILLVSALIPRYGATIDSLKDASLVLAAALATWLSKRRV